MQKLSTIKIIKVFQFRSHVPSQVVLRYLKLNEKYIMTLQSKILGIVNNFIECSCLVHMILDVLVGHYSDISGHKGRDIHALGFIHAFRKKGVSFIQDIDMEIEREKEREEERDKEDERVFVERERKREREKEREREREKERLIDRESEREAYGKRDIGW